MKHQPGLFDAKFILVEECLSYYLTPCWWEDKETNTFSKDIRPKVNVIERQEFELANYDFTV